MAKTDYKSIDDYISNYDAEEQNVLKKIKSTIQEAVPDAEGVISYQVPAFRYHGWIFYFGAYKNHYSISCPPPWTVFEKFKKELSGYEISKSTIQFPKSQAFPFDLLTRMSAFRAKENLEREKNKPKKK
jgi:uncharacterized protein YdhG (YjbR/CyaY superfamily)